MASSGGVCFSIDNGVVTKSRGRNSASSAISVEGESASCGGSGSFSSGRNGRLGSCCWARCLSGGSWGLCGSCARSLGCCCTWSLGSSGAWKKGLEKRLFDLKSMRASEKIISSDYKPLNWSLSGSCS